MDRLDAMALFVSAVDEGSLAAAARRHGRSRAAVSRAVGLLEHNAGTTLLLRSTRNLSLTSAGEHHLAIWREVLLKLGEVEPDRFDASLSGRIVFTAPELFGRLIMMPVVETFLQTHPQVTVNALLRNRVTNLMGEGIDLAVRLAPLPDSTLMARKVGEVRVLYCASPQYLSERGSPVTPSDLEGHDCIGLNAASEAELWPFMAVGERKNGVRSLRVQTRVSVDYQAAVIDAALRGQGIIFARSYQVAEHIASGRLVPLLSDFEPPAVPAHILYPADKYQRGVVRSFIEHLVSVLKKELSRIEIIIQSDEVSRRAAS